MYCGPSITTEVSLIFLPKFVHLYAIIMQEFSYLDESIATGYSQPPILISPHLRWVVKLVTGGIGLYIIICVEGSNDFSQVSLTMSHFKVSVTLVPYAKLK